MTPAAPAPQPPSRILTADARWDALIAVLCVSVLFDIGRLHLLFPILQILHPALLCFASGVLLCFMGRNVGKGLLALRHPLVYLMGAMLLWSALSVPGSVYPGLSFSFVVGTMLRTMGMTVLMAIAVRGPRDVKRLLFSFFISALIYSLVVLARFHVNPGERLADLYTYDANDLALFIVCTVPFALYLVLRSPWLVRKLMAIGALLILAVVFVWTGSRGGFIALLVVMAVIVFTWKSIKLPWRVGAVVVGLLVLFLAANQSYWSTMANIVAPEDDYNVTSANGRVQVWKRGLGYMVHNPVLGVGVNAFPNADGRFSGLAELMPVGRGYKWSAAHNSFVQIGAELGIPGLVMFIVFAAILFRAAWRLSRPSQYGQFALPPPGPTLAGLMFAALCGFFVAAFFLSQAYGSILYFLTAMVLSLHRIAVRTAVQAAIATRLAA
jgi:O-antigen ligase